MNVRNFIIVAFIFIFCSCRNEPTCFDLRKNTENQILLSGEACYQVVNYQKVDFNYLKNSNQEEYLNYVKTLLCTWEHAKKFTDSLPPGLLLQALAFVGDIQNMNSISANEIVSDKDYKFKVPVDQTFYAENDTVWLALRLGENYKIVFRDSQNGIIQQETMRP
jgi:hypothetical protein